MRQAAWLRAALLSCAVTLSPAGAWASEAEAAAHFDAGVTASARGDYRAAAASFEASFRLKRHGLPAYNAGSSWERLREPARAADAYDAALAAGGLNEVEASWAHTRLAELERSLGRVELSGPGGATVRLGHADGPLPAHVRLAPGDHPLTVRFADGREARQSVTVRAGTVIVLDLQPPTTTEPREPLARASSQDEVPAESNGHAFIIGGWVTTAGALALGATALGLGAAGIAARDDFVDGGRTNADQQDQAETLRTANVVVWVLAGAAGVAGVTLLVLGYSDGDAEVARRHPQPSMALELRPSGVTLSATF